MPDRIQLRRAKGWRKPPGAVVVARPTRWGNPWKVGDVVEVGYFSRASGTPGHFERRGVWCDDRAELTVDAELAVWLYRENLLDALAGFGCDEEDSRAARDELLAAVESLRGRDLACWCPLGGPCHADVLLEVANR